MAEVIAFTLQKCIQKVQVLTGSMRLMVVGEKLRSTLKGGTFGKDKKKTVKLGFYQTLPSKTPQIVTKM